MIKEILDDSWFIYTFGLEHVMSVERRSSTYDTLDCKDTASYKKTRTKIALITYQLIQGLNT